jgi:hypothetical protein
VWRVLKKPYNAAKQLLGIYLKECESDYSKDTCMSMLIGALLTISKLWRNSQDAPLLMSGLSKRGFYIQ